MGRSPCCEKVGLKKGPWTPEEDQKLLAYIDRYGHGSWRALPAKAGLQRCGKSCRLRWTNYLRPDIKRGKFSLQEEQTIIQLHALLGNRWSAIATHLPKRTDNEIKNYWNTHLKKRLTKMGIDPVTHKPKNNALLLGSNNSQYSKDTANLNHMAQWENARLEAEARLVRESKVAIMSSNIPYPRLRPPPPPPPPPPSSSSSSSSVVLPAPPLKQPLMIPPCLDILTAWHRQWTTTTTNPNNNNVLQLNSNFGSLESPTSVFNFSDYNKLQVLHPSKPQETPVPPTRKLDNVLQSNINHNKCPEKETPTTFLHEFESFPVDDHHNHDHDHDIPCINSNSSNIPEEDGPSFLEGFGEDLLSDHDDEVFNYNMIGFNDDNLGGCYNGYNLEDNNKYWNAII